MKSGNKIKLFSREKQKCRKGFDADNECSSHILLISQTKRHSPPPHPTSSLDSPRLSKTCDRLQKKKRERKKMKNKNNNQSLKSGSLRSFLYRFFVLVSPIFAFWARHCLAEPEFENSWSLKIFTCLDFAFPRVLSPSFSLTFSLFFPVFT